MERLPKRRPPVQLPFSTRPCICIRIARPKPDDKIRKIQNPICHLSTRAPTSLHRRCSLNFPLQSIFKHPTRCCVCPLPPAPEGWPGSRRLTSRDLHLGACQQQGQLGVQKSRILPKTEIPSAFAPSAADIASDASALFARDKVVRHVCRIS